MIKRDCVFTLHLKLEELAENLISLIDLLKMNSSLNDLSDISIISTKGSVKLENQIKEVFKSKFDDNHKIDFNTYSSKINFANKRFVFIILPKFFFNLKIKRILSKSFPNNNFTNIIFVTNKKKVKDFPSFTSHFNNAVFR